ncbi:hypothetical protein GYB29_13840 [bacterium]|nr:hypothetical protein [Balneola sp.]MBR9918721.1 hypothetical protein [bacterium]
MKKNGFWLIISVLTLLFSWLFYPQEFGNRETYLVISSYLGRVAGFFLLPLIVALIFKGITKLFKKDFNSKSFRTTFLVIWILLSLSGLTNFLYDSSQTPFSESYTTNSQDARFIYWGEGNEYSVSFKEEPETKESYFLGNDLTSEIAELVLLEDASYVRSESALYTDSFSREMIDKQYVIQMLQEYAKYNGLLYPEFGYEKNELGKIGNLRGYKTLEDNTGKKIEVTFSVRAYFGEKSLFILQGTSPSQIFPTSEIVTFFESIEKPGN